MTTIYHPLTIYHLLRKLLSIGDIECGDGASFFRKIVKDDGKERERSERSLLLLE
jgi:hypothetical protein